MAVKSTPASGDPAAERRSCMRYFFNVKQTATSDHGRPWPKPQKQKYIQNK